MTIGILRGIHGIMVNLLSLLKKPVGYRSYLFCKICGQSVINPRYVGMMYGCRCDNIKNINVVYYPDRDEYQLQATCRNWDDIEVMGMLMVYNVKGTRHFSLDRKVNAVFEDLDDE